MPAAVRPLARTRCLVTGGAGFLGRNLVRALRERACDVVAFDAAEATFDDAAVVAVRGDLRDRDAVARALEGVDVVFHTAALIELARFAPASVAERVRSVNVDATSSLLELAEARGVSRLVHTSSTATVLGVGAPGGDESLPYSTYPNLYTTTKVEAEKRVRGHRGRLLTCSLRPGGIYGPGERNQLVAPTFAALVDGNPLTVIGDGTARLDYTHVDNLVDAQLAAAERLVEGSPVVGGAYFVTDGQPINHGEFTRRLLNQLGMLPPIRHVPVSALRTFAYLAERRYQLTGAAPPLTLGHVDPCVQDFHFSIDAARRDLGYTPRHDTDAGIRTMLHDVEGYLRSIGFRGC